MPSIRSPLHYPKEYFDLIRMAAVENKITTVPCENEEEARKLRGHFYAFLGSLKRAALGKTPEYVEEYAWGQRTMCYLDKTTLSFMPRDESWQSKRVRNALAGGHDATPMAAATILPSDSLLELLDPIKGHGEGGESPK